MSSLLWLDQDEVPLPHDDSGRQFLRLLAGPCSPLDVRVRVERHDPVDRLTLSGDAEETLEMIGNGVFRRAPRSNARLDREPSSLSAAGELLATAWRGNAIVDRSRLRILAANFSDSEYQRMLLDVGLIAASSASWIHGEVSATGVDSSRDNLQVLGLRRHRRMSDTGAVLDCVNVIKLTLPTLERRPLTTIVRKVQPTPIHQAARDRNALRSITRNPARRVVQRAVPVESVDTEENRLIKWIIEQRLHPFIRFARLRDQLRVALPADEELGRMLARAARRNPRLKEIEARATDHRSSNASPTLGTSEATLLEVLRSPMLREVRSIDYAPEVSERMLGTPGYRDILGAYRHASMTWGPSFERGLQVINLVVRRELRATWEIYEIWCFLQMAHAFGEIAGFGISAPGVAEMLIIKNGEMRLQKGGTVRLVRGKTQVTLTYEPKIPSSRDAKARRVADRDKTLRPDFLLSVSRPGTPAKCFVLDAKYRNYAEQGVAALGEDIVKTALLKYLDGFRSAPDHPNKIWPSSSIILHSDPSPLAGNLDYWGGVPAEEWLPAAAWSPPEGLDAADLKEVSGIRGHAVGLVRLRPDGTAPLQLGRLVDLLLQYHVPGHNHECPRCGTTLRIGIDVRMEDAGKTKDVEHETNWIRRGDKEGWRTSVICVCPTCAHFWFQNHCRNKHPLFKIGRRSFHAASRQPWPQLGMYVCPTCGDDPGPGDFDRDRAGQGNPEPAVRSTRTAVNRVFNPRPTDKVYDEEPF